ncbi:MAG: molybdate transport system regulatory protein [Streptomyces sp.]|nr:molybdate transport system regulatory protein [Streptomyces sp.]
MGLSMRNQIAGTVVSVEPGEVMAVVKVALGRGELTAAVTKEAVRELGIVPGGAVTALVKATEVAVATGPVEGLSIRNRLAGTVVGVVAGEAMATVRIAVADVGVELTAAITRDAVADLGIGEGVSVVALIKATDVALSTLPV